MGVWVGGWVGEWMNGWMGGWVSGWMDGWVDKFMGGGIMHTDILTLKVLVMTTDALEHV